MTRHAVINGEIIPAAITLAIPLRIPLIKNEPTMTKNCPYLILSPCGQSKS